MKKIKMIVTSIAVLTIVGSAIAFNVKKIGKFCVTNKTANIGCYTLNASKRTTGSGIVLLYKPDWDGASCTTGSGCNTLDIFTND